MTLLTPLLFFPREEKIQTTGIWEIFLLRKDEIPPDANSEKSEKFGHAWIWSSFAIRLAFPSDCFSLFHPIAFPLLSDSFFIFHSSCKMFSETRISLYSFSPQRIFGKRGKTMLRRRHSPLPPSRRWRCSRSARRRLHRADSRCRIPSPIP